MQGYFKRLKCLTKIKESIKWKLLIDPYDNCLHIWKPQNAMQ